MKKSHVKSVNSIFLLEKSSQKENRKKREETEEGKLMEINGK